MKTVLLIDDDRAFRTTIAAKLVQAGWRVLEAEDGESGFTQAIEQQPDVVLCNLVMPRCNGFQLCRQLRARRDGSSKIRIVVSSDSCYATDHLHALEAGADEFFVKPIDPPQLLTLLKRVTGDSIDHPESPAPTGKQERPPTFKFWGVRGSVPTPGPATVFYGGNTSCVELRADGEIIILDAGTGIRGLGLALEEEYKGRIIDMTLLITHTHWDHIQGFPFFLPAYNAQNKVQILGYEGVGKGLVGTLSAQMESPYFPISMQQMPGNITVRELKDFKFAVGKVTVQAAFVNHPGICTGFRLQTSGGSLAYFPDIEPFYRLRAPAEPPSDASAFQSLEYARNQDRKLVDFIRDVDVLIIDCQYDEEEYKTHVGWGHSCAEDSVALAMEAKVKKVFMFHHDPGHDDKKIAQMVAKARQTAEEKGSDLIIEAAREGLEVVLDKPVRNRA